MRFSLLLFILLLLCHPFEKLFSSENRNPFPLPPDAISASYDGGPFSNVLNPVFSDTAGRSYFAYRYFSYSKGDSANHFLGFNIFGLSLIYSRYNEIFSSETNQYIDAESNLFNINKGFFFGNTFGFGGGYSFSRSDNPDFDNYKSFNTGFLLRPSRFFSFAFTMHDIKGEYNNMELNRRDTWSVSLRPYFQNITLSADGSKLNSEKFKDMDYTFAAGCKLPNDIELTGKIDTDKNMQFALSIPLFFRTKYPSSMVIDGYASSFENSGADYYSAGISYSIARNTKAKEFYGTRNLLYIKFDHPVKEVERPVFFGEKNPVFTELLSAIINAGDDRTIKGLFLEIDRVSFGMAQIQEIRNEILKIRESGKKVYAVLNYPGNKEYYIASTADTIYFTPNSPFYLTGLSAQVYFFKGLLDKAGVEYESVRYGKYKSLNEPATRESMSPEFRENMESLLANMNEHFVSDIASGRNLDEQAITDLFNKGFYLPSEAKEKGFIDEIMYKDEALKKAGENVFLVDFKDYIKEKVQLRQWGPVPAIAVIHVNGTIIPGESHNSAFDSNIGDATYSKTLENVFKSNIVKALVIRVDSGGGSASASDYMWRELARLKEKYPKPVVFSFGNTAASGGYYIACTGDEILASRGTITGSIGVIAGKLNLSELYERLGINKEVIKMSEFADIFSESKKLTEKERNLIQEGINFTYRRFTGKVAEARGFTMDTIPQVAEGRVFTGDQAVEKNLVNQNGGIMAAIELAKTRADLNGNYNVLHLPEGRLLLPGLIRGTTGSSFFNSLIPAISNIEKYNMLKDEPHLYLQPYYIEIE
jgi:protease-4